jgi:hypothetical protein
LLFREGVWARWLNLAWTLLGVVVFARDDLLGQNWKLGTYAFRLDWWAWLAVWAGTSTAWLFEASFRISRRNTDEISNLADQLQSKICLSFSPDSAIEHRVEKPPRLVFCVSVENMGNAPLTRCQVRLRCQRVDVPDSRAVQMHGWQNCCPPFDLVVDDRTLVPVLALENPFVAPQPDYLSTVGAVQRNGEWVEPEGMLVLDQSKKYDVWIEALSSESRRTEIKLSVHFDQSWRIAPS